MEQRPSLHQISEGDVDEGAVKGQEDTTRGGLLPGRVVLPPISVSGPRASHCKPKGSSLTFTKFQLAAACIMPTIPAVALHEAQASPTEVGAVQLDSIKTRVET
jgi:hypothetical protein